MRDKIPARERSIELLELLTRYTGKTIAFLSEYFNVDKRTIQRDIASLRKAGYVIENINGKYKINPEKTRREVKFRLSDLVHFTKEEAYILNEAIRNIEGNDLIKKNLVKKLTSLHNIDELLETVSHLQGAEEVKTIAHAIENKYQLEVIEYLRISGNQGLRSVIIEPIQFASNYTRVWAYYPRKNINFLLRMSGIHGVKPTYKPYQYEQYHKVGYMDVFNGYGFSKTNLKMIINKRAYGYILEEYPQAVPSVHYIKRHNYLLKTEICSFMGVGRFCLGLPGSVRVIEPQGLIDYIKQEKKKNYTFFDVFNEVSRSPMTDKK
jgi:predicted DNA-binding transcriptional regulator YafY